MGNFFKTQPKSSSMIKRKRSELLEQMYIEIGDIYDLQLEELKTACFESFRKGLSKLRVSPTLPQDMQKVASDAVKQFSKQSKGLLPSTSKASQYVSDWSSTYNAKKQFQRHLTEYCTDRLNVARASGNYRPLPRKGVTWVCTGYYQNHLEMIIGGIQPMFIRVNNLFIHPQLIRLRRLGMIKLGMVKGIGKIRLFLYQEGVK